MNNPEHVTVIMPPDVISKQDVKKIVMRLLSNAGVAGNSNDSEIFWYGYYEAISAVKERITNDTIQRNETRATQEGKQQTKAIGPAIKVSGL